VTQWSLVEGGRPPGQDALGDGDAGADPLARIMGWFFGVAVGVGAGGENVAFSAAWARTGTRSVTAPSVWKFSTMVMSDPLRSRRVSPVRTTSGAGPVR
jgi:hypothetical protein